MALSGGSGFNYSFDKSKESIKKEYFSGANVHVYFGSVWVDQIASIEFQLQEQVAPIYGFHSYTFDKISRGNRIVQGSFTLSFTENGYLQTILDRVASEVGKYKEQGTVAAGETLAEMAKYTPEQTIETILSTGGTDSYTDYIDSLKQSFWGGDNGNSLIRQDGAKDNDSYFYAKRNGEENPLREQGFNILIDYSPDANYADFERCLKRLNTNTSVLQTFRTITGVHITGVSQPIMNNGQVLTQTYQFIARDLDGDITETSLSDTFLYDFESISKSSTRTANETTKKTGSSAGAGAKKKSTTTSNNGGYGAGGGGGGGAR